MVTVIGFNTKENAPRKKSRKERTVTKKLFVYGKVQHNIKLKGTRKKGLKKEETVVICIIFSQIKKD